ncbi:MAG: hydroxysqualene dehydroxylase HpnE [Chloroflexota bacterium]
MAGASDHARALGIVPSAIIIGAGLAGLTAAVDLVDAGWEVLVLERRPFAGGRAFSYLSPEGDELDNGQHVFLGCCRAYLGLLEKLGTRGQAYLQRRLDVRMVDAKDGPARLASTHLPAPLHLLPSFLRFPYLSRAEKVLAARTLLLIRLGHLPEHESFAHWLRRQGQTERTIRRLWDLIIIPTCNAACERVSARQAGFVFAEGLLRAAGGGNLGYARVGLSEIAPKAAVAYIRAAGGTVRLGVTASALQREGDRILAVRTSGGQDLQADAVISAIPFDQLGGLVREPWARQAANLEYGSIVGLNLWYDRPLLAGEVLAVTGEQHTYWLFDRGHIRGGPLPGGQRLAVSISDAGRLMDVPRGELVRQVTDDLVHALSKARGAGLARATVSKVRRATFVPSAGSARWRLPARTPLRNLVLAGAWTDTGWPDTMEGAVRSGHTAAKLAISAASSLEQSVEETTHGHVGQVWRSVRGNGQAARQKIGQA